MREETSRDGTFQNKYLTDSVSEQPVTVHKGVCNGLTRKKETSWLRKKDSEGERKKGKRNYSGEGTTQKADFHHHTIPQRKGNVFSQLFFRFLSIYWNIFKQLQWVSNVLC